MNPAEVVPLVRESDPLLEVEGLRAALENEREETARLRRALEAVVDDARALHARLPTCGQVSRDTAAGALLMLAGTAMDALEGT